MTVFKSKFEEGKKEKGDREEDIPASKSREELRFMTKHFLIQVWLNLIKNTFLKESHLRPQSAESQEELMFLAYLVHVEQ